LGEGLAPALERLFADHGAAGSIPSRNCAQR
jgi:hypothetical protein